MIAAGVIGAGILGFIQDKSVDKNILAYDKANSTNIHSTYVTENKTSFFGDYKALDQNKLATASADDNVTVTGIRDTAKKEALRDIVIFPIIMLVSYVLLIFYFRSKGGYKAVVLKKESANRTPFIKTLINTDGFRHYIWCKYLVVDLSFYNSIYRGAISKDRKNGF